MLEKKCWEAESFIEISDSCDNAETEFAFKFEFESDAEDDELNDVEVEVGDVQAA